MSSFYRDPWCSISLYWTPTSRQALSSNELFFFEVVTVPTGGGETDQLLNRRMQWRVTYPIIRGCARSPRPEKPLTVVLELGLEERLGVCLGTSGWAYFTGGKRRETTWNSWEPHTVACVQPRCSSLKTHVNWVAGAQSHWLSNESQPKLPDCISTEISEILGWVAWRSKFIPLKVRACRPTWQGRPWPCVTQLLSACCRFLWPVRWQHSVPKWAAIPPHSPLLKRRS